MRAAMPDGAPNAWFASGKRLHVALDVLGPLTQSPRGGGDSECGRLASYLIAARGGARAHDPRYARAILLYARSAKEGRHVAKQRSRRFSPASSSVHLPRDLLEALGNMKEKL
jgi:hypothetical protein